MKVGIVGLPNSGKTTLFNALTKGHATTAPYPFTTVDPNIGVAPVPDERLVQIASVTHPERVIQSMINFLDVAGLVKGASQGEGLGNQFLSQIRGTSILLHVVRCFQEADIPHVYGEVEPKRDIEIVNLELILSDLEVLERRLAKISKQARSGDKQAQHEASVLKKAEEGLNKGVPLRLQGFSQKELELLRAGNFLTDKPTLYVANISEDGQSEEAKRVREVAEDEKTMVVELPVRLEAELEELSDEEKAEFLKELGLESSLSQVVKASFSLLKLVTFFTTESNEVKAWLLQEDGTAEEAAGLIHTDMRRGFIKAEVVNWKHLVEAGSFHQARERGYHRVEGREYRIHDGDVLLFHFRV